MAKNNQNPTANQAAALVCQISQGSSVPTYPTILLLSLKKEIPSVSSWTFLSLSLHCPDIPRLCLFGWFSFALFCLLWPLAPLFANSWFCCFFAPDHGLSSNLAGLKAIDSSLVLTKKPVVAKNPFSLFWQITPTRNYLDTKFSLAIPFLCFCKPFNYSKLETA